MNQIQENYALALAMMETLEEERKKRFALLPNIPHPEGGRRRHPDTIKAQCEIEDELGYWKAIELKCEAADQLIKWGASVLKEADPVRFAQVEVVFQRSFHKHPQYRPAIREKAIDLTMRLNPSQ